MVVEDVYFQNEDQPLSERVVEAIECYEGTDLDKTDFQLGDYVDPDALDTVFESSDREIVIQFSTSDMTVTLRGSNEVNLRVTPRNDVSSNLF